MVGSTLLSLVSFWSKRSIGRLPTSNGLIMCMEAQLLTYYNEGTSGSSHSYLDPMKVIMKELQLMRKDMKEMRGNITNLSMEHKDQSNIGGHVTFHTQWGYGNFSPHA
ncbi:hypothetical protein M9H77_06990 [Catharanthus roseus]|uniref:Uncharacterized protein n=1 Tax=Catharanthus roseus TaxID=4058 RepID=A0ACC0BTM6_CATRO|nr:hypothetical protein M9H77_06990 [Catharanthus roseus]